MQKGEEKNFSGSQQAAATLLAAMTPRRKLNSKNKDKI